MPAMREKRDTGKVFSVGEDELRRWLERLTASEFTVTAPVEKDAGQLAYAATRDASRIVIDPARPISSPKAVLHPPREEIARKDLEHQPPDIIFGIHACDLNGLKILASAFLSTYTDPLLKARVERTAVVGVTCLEPGVNCFCTSMGTGPSISDGYDLLLTRLGSAYLLEVGTERGRKLTLGMELSKAPEEMQAKKKALLEQVRQRMPKQFKTLGVPELLMRNYENPAWEDFGKLCLGCANCTMLCPTCFCYDLRDWASPDLKEAGRTRAWDSCQSMSFASVHGGNYRPLQKARLRQFVCHKLAFWIEQYGMFGCVGCGRCMTWCPTGIDLTLIAERIRESEG